MTEAKRPKQSDQREEKRLQINQNKRLITLKSVETVNLKYERLLKLLLKIHENLTE